MVPKGERLLQLASSLLFLRTLGKWTLFIVGYEVNHPLIPKIRVKTKVESFILEIPMGSLKGTSSIGVTSLTQDSLGSFAIISLSPQGPSRRTRSKQKIAEELVEREREGQGLIPSSLILSFLVACCLLILFHDLLRCYVSLSIFFY